MQDLIDFPCSPIWLDHYYDQGLTPRHSSEYHEQHDHQIRELRLEIRNLRDRLAEQIVAPPSSPSRQSPPPKPKRSTHGVET